MYKVRVKIDCKSYILYGDDCYMLYQEINKKQNLVNLLNMGYGFCVNSELESLKELEAFINKEETHKLTIEDIRNLSVKLTIGDILVEAIEEI